MPDHVCTFLPALRRALLLARLRRAGRAVLRQWTLVVFVGCYVSENPRHPAGTVCAAILFLWLRHLIEQYRITVTFHRRGTPADLHPTPPICHRCPRAAGQRLPSNFLN